MANTIGQSRLQIPAGTRQKLDEYRKRVWKVKLIEGLCAAAFGLLVSYLLVFVLDRFFDTPAWLRTTLLLAGAVGLAILFPLKCHRWIWRTRHFDQLARLLKHRMPRLSDRMLGIIELAENDLEQQRSAALCEAALRQVDGEIRELSFHDAVPNPKHRAWSWATAVPLSIACLALVVVPAAGFNAISRWLMPWRQTERYTFAQLEQLPNELVVPYSEQFNFQAPLSAKTASSPSKATARIGKQPVVEVAIAENKYAFEMPPQKQDGDLLLSVGDARKTITVQPKLRPELTELTAEVDLPDYLQYTQSLIRDARGGSLSVVRGSHATLVAKVSRDLVAATLNGEPQDVIASTITTNQTVLDEPTTLRLSWADQYGLTAKQPFELSVQTNDDLPPSIVCSELSRQQVVLVNQVLAFKVNADDDFGLKQIGLEWRGLEDPLENPVPAVGETLIQGGEPEATELTATATFCAARENIEPQTLQIRLYATDYLPERERVYSPPYTLFVLSAAEHANWLTEQMRRWSRQAQEVYETENQLYENNKALRALSAEELDRDENRQRLATQAAAETSNARQLNAVSGAGKQLILEAAKNDQFQAVTMENLAQMVKALDEMAGKRMPSVADLLKQAAKASSKAGQGDPKDGDGAEGSEGKPEESAPQVGNNRDPNNQEEGKGGEPSGDDKKSSKAPSINDIESSMNKPDENKEDGGEQPKKKPSPAAGAFGLPSTTVLGGGPKQKPQAKREADEPSMQEKLDEAIEEQEDLLEEFSKVAEELQRILDSLEGSTFVKRLKAASRRQLDVAEDLNKTLSEKFGSRPSQLDDRQQQESQLIAEREQSESQNLSNIKQDLEAYYARVQQGKFLTVIQEMEKMTVTAKLDRLAELVTDNLLGQSIAHAEYWADTFDRWGEQLVGPGQPPSDGDSPPGAKSSSLSPSIVLDIMKVLEKEVGLREETRSTEQARSAMETEKYTQRANSLAETQGEIAQQLTDAIQAIRDLEEEKGLTFQKELQMLGMVEEVMLEAEQLLSRPDTGAEPLAAETQAIELLLQAQRKQPPKKNSKGGSGQSPNGGGEGDTEESALALIGRGDEMNAERVERATRQTTGVTSAGYPAEYRTGLDAYFGRLEKEGGQ